MQSEIVILADRGGIWIRAPEKDELDREALEWILPGLDPEAREFLGL